jgi:single-stranded DNA-specific DHH superfamily exonuclease
VEVMDGNEKIAVIADWDADGVIAAAAIVYSQEKLGVFPVKGKRKVELIPSGPRELEHAFKEKCWDILIILDIPFSQEVSKALDDLYSRGCRPKIYYFDHHPVTLENMNNIETKYNALAILGKSPTAILVRRFLDGLNVKLTPRLSNLVDAIGTLEGGGWLRNKQQVPEGIVKLAASISKALNQSKDKGIWEKYVEWASNPLPFEQSLLKQNSEDDFKNVIELGFEVSKENDKEIKEKAMELAMSAKNLGYIKFIDARDKWNKSGASALTSAIFKILKVTTALLAEKKEDNVRLLIIRSGKGEALKIMKNLFVMGITEDVGGHGNIAVAKVKPEVTVRNLEEALRKASVQSLQEGNA